MAITNDERVRTALELLKAGLRPFVEREFTNTYPERGVAEAPRFLGEDRLNAKRPLAEWDVAVLLRVMWGAWYEVFSKTLGPAERSLVMELRDVRNRWAHQQPFSNDDAERALDSAARLLTAVSVPQADEVGKMKMELRRLIFAEQMRSEMPKGTGGGAGTSSDGSHIPKQKIPKPEGKTKPFVGPRDKYFLVETYIKQNYKGWIGRPPSKATGENFLVTDATTGKSVSLYVRFSQDKLQKHCELYNVVLGNKLMAMGWWALRTRDLRNSRADFWVFVLPSLSERTTSFIIFPPRELLQRLQPIRDHIGDWIQLYLLPTKDGRCWETRDLPRKFDRAIDNGTYSDPARDFSAFLNAWHLVAAKLK